MHTITSFHASAVEAGQISAVMTEYLALERARIYRRLFVIRFGLVALVLAVVGVGLRWLPPAASWAGIGVSVFVPAWAWLAELRYGRRLARRLEQISESVKQAVVPPEA